jgi:hypothetical protein
MEAHLVVLGWWPVRLKQHSYQRGWMYCVRSERQYCGVAWDKVQLETLYGREQIEETPWWRITDDVLRRIVATVDSNVGGWSGE